MGAFPFSAIVGQEEMKRALLIAAVDARVGGVMIFGDRGTGKSTAARSLAATLPPIPMVAGCGRAAATRSADGGGADATGVLIEDTLPAEVTFDSSYTIRVGGTVDGSGVCQTDGATSGGSFASGVVSGTIASVPAGETRTLLFRAAIN